MHVDCDCFMPLVRVCSIHFYLLERLSNISIFSIIPELVHYRDELLMILVQAAYDIAGDIALHHSTSKVTDHLTSIVCSVIEDMALMANGIQDELLDLMVCALCQDEKRQNPNGFAMMRKVIASCPNNFQPYLERQLHQVFPLHCHFRSRVVLTLAGLLVQKKVLTPCLVFGRSFLRVATRTDSLSFSASEQAGCFLTRLSGQVKTGIQLDSDLTNKDRLAEAVFELSTAAPKCLTGV